MLLGVGPSSSEKRERWQTVIPLFAGEHIVGRLVVHGRNQPGLSSCESLEQLVNFVEPIENEIVELAAVHKKKEPEAVSTGVVSAISRELSI